MSNNSNILIVDLGSYMTRVGYMGDKKPKYLIPTMFSFKKAVYRKDNRDDSHLNPEEFEFNALGYNSYKHVYPISKGEISIFDRIFPLLNYIFNLKININPKDCRVLFVNGVVNSNNNQNILLDIMFNKFQISAVGFVPDPIATSKAYNLDSCIVIDFGNEKTDISVVLDGKLDDTSFERLDIGRQDIIHYFRKLVSQNSINDFIHLKYKLQTHSILNNLGFINQKDMEEKASKNLQIQQSYIYEDGKSLNLINEQSTVYEILFDPSLVGSQSKGLPGLLTKVLKNYDLKTQKHLLSNIILKGSTAKTPGLNERLIKEIKKNLPNEDFNIKTESHINNASWVGASRMVKQFENKDWVTAEDYTKPE